MAVELYTDDAHDVLDGPDWLSERRRHAQGTLAGLDLPTAELEEWRYSRIGDLDPTRFAPLSSRPDVTSVPVVAAELVAALGPLAAVVVVHNGVVVRSELSPEAQAAGVSVGVAGPADTGVLGAAMGEPPDAFVALNDALSVDPVLIDVPRNVVLERPIAVVSHVDVDGAVVFPRISVRAGENSEVAVIEASLSSDVEALVVPVTEILVGPAARVRHSALQDVGERVWQLGSFVAEVGQDASLRSGVAALGGSYARLRLDCRLVGRGATGDLASVYFGDGDQMLDLRTFQEHRAPDTTSNLLFKGAVADHSHSVYTGLIRIKPEARGTNAFQTNRNLKLSDHAWAESVPNLEIENNDVHCSHASTVGPVDEDQRFYLESRGVPTSAAERLIVAGFFDEVLDAFPVPQLAPSVRDRLTVLLDRQVGRGLGSSAPIGSGAAT